jgi:hypothetical protein
MAKKSAPTAEEVKAAIDRSIEHNVNEYQARVQALRSLHEQKAYNPLIDPTTLGKAAAEAAREAAVKPSSDGNVRLATSDREAEAQAKARGWKGGKETDDQEGEGGQGQAGNGGVQKGQAAFGFLSRSEGQESQASRGDSVKPVWTEQTWEAESEEAVKALVPQGAKAVETRMVWKATALVRQA